MKLLMTSNASYAPPRGGSTRSNLVWLRHLAASGHQCRVVSASLDVDSACIQDALHIHSVKDLARRASVLQGEIQQFSPDLVLVSSEDLSHVLLRESARSAPGRLIYLAHTPQFYPFGPESWNPDPKASALIREARAIVAIGTHAAGYIRQYLGVSAAVVHPPMYGQPPYPRFGSSGKGWLLMINPCAVKGLPIFLALARRFPNLEFAALAGWGTTTTDRQEMAALPNVRVLETVPKIDDVLARARLLLMPSLWYEGFGLIVMEAMLRGLPVIASDSGGLIEAKHGTRFVIPVRPIERYLPEFDETHMPRPILPDQDIQPWVEAIESITRDRSLYDAESEQSRAVALEFVSRLDAADFEKLLLSLKPAPPPRQLTPEQRAILARRLRERGRV
ncbi:MAG TPA: glycosyltransferase family 4 protein [Bryobacteraceae bacterium]